MSDSPIFIHSLWRAGSTYLFNVFRRSTVGYYCYQEPLHEILLNLNVDPGKIPDFWGNAMIELRHPKLDRPYFWEFWEIRDSLRDLFKKSFSYDDFFVDVPPGLPDDQRKYFNALIKNAKGRPVFQECRSTGRIAALKEAFGGVHIHLWREPRNQWWSFKVNNYFDATVQRIFNAGALPAVLLAVKQECGIMDFHHEDIQVEFENAFKRPLPSRQNYFAFFALWLYSFLECEKHKDVTISIDMLSADAGYRDDCSKELMNFGIEGLDFSDCSIPRMVFTQEDTALFAEVERYTFDVFLQYGYKQAELQKVEEVLKCVRSIEPSRKDVLNDLIRSHSMVLRYLDRVSETSQELVSQQACINQLQTDLHAARAQLDQEASRVEELEALRNDLEAARARIDSLEAQVHRWRSLAESLSKRAAGRQSSGSRQLMSRYVGFPSRLAKQLWRITRLAGSRVLSSLPQRALKKCVRGVVNLILACPRLKSILKKVLTRDPRLHAVALRLLSRLSATGHLPPSGPAVLPGGMAVCNLDDVLIRMPPRAREIYAELKKVMEKRVVETEP